MVFLCRLGLHRWDTWAATLGCVLTGPLPASLRVCLRCGRVEYRVERGRCRRWELMKRGRR